ncbi:hypothetical protein V8F33_001109 [Rhypophila sp. PSN 637]
MEVVDRPSTPTQHKSDTKRAGNNAPEVVDQYQDGDKIGSPALLIYQPESPPPPQHQSSWQQQQQPTSLHRQVPIEHHYYHNGRSPALPVPPVDDLQAWSEKRVCGLGRSVFLVLLVLAWLAIVGVGVGVGVKIGVLDRNQGSDNDDGASSNSGNSALASLQCPEGANTQVQTTGGAKFLHLCGVDFSGPGEATDIASERTPTFKECLEACARTQGCTGAGWGPALPDKPARATCWMKNNLNLSHDSPPDWNFGIRLD